MPSLYPPDEPPPSREKHPPRGSSRDFDDYGPPSYKGSRHDSPRKPRRRDDYDASDEDELTPLRSPPMDGGGRRSRGSKDRGSAPVPPPPIGKNRQPGYDDGVQPSRPPVENGYDDEAPPSRHRRRPEYDDPPPPLRDQRRRRTDQDLDDPPTRKDTLRDYARDQDRRRRSERDIPPRHYDDDETDPYDRKPPRRQRSDRERNREHDRGYRSDAPRRRDRDDFERGYRTDGRDARRDRDRRRERNGHRGPPPEESHDYHDSRRDRDRDRRRSSNRKSPPKKNDFGEILEKGQKGWEKVAPVAKPALKALATKYLAE